MNPHSHQSNPARRLAIGAIASLVLLTRPLVPTVPTTDPSALGSFLREYGAVTTAASALRSAAILGTIYVLLIAVLAMVASLGRPGARLGGALRRVTLPALRFALPGTVGLCLLTAPAGANTPTIGSAHSVGHPESNANRSATTVVLNRDRDAIVLLPGPTAAAPLAHRRPDPSTPPTTTSTATSTEVAPSSDETASFRLETSTTTAPDTTVAGTSTERTATSERTTGRAFRSNSTARRRVDPKSTQRDDSVRRRTRTDDHLTGHRTGTRPPSRVEPGDGTVAIAPPAVAVTPPRPRADNPTDHIRRSGATWTVRAGDHLWHIASATLAARNGRPPTDAEIVPYWRRLVEANRGHLVDPDNPDLILPGQVFTLP